MNEIYAKKSRTSEKVELIEIDEEAEMARVKNLRTETLQTKTLHWCRKNLVILDEYLNSLANNKD